VTLNKYTICPSSGIGL